MSNKIRKNEALAMNEATTVLSLDHVEFDHLLSKRQVAASIYDNGSQ